MSHHPHHPHLPHEPVRQIPPGAYTLALTWYDGAGEQHVSQLGMIYPTGSTGITIDGNATTANTEYWYIDESVGAQVGSSSSNSIAFTSTSLVDGANYASPTYTNRQAFTVAEVVTWTENRGGVRPVSGQTSSYFKGTSSGGTTWLQLVTRVSSGLGPVNDIGWFVQGASAPSGGLITPSGTFSSVTSGPPDSPTFWGVVQSTT
jgi:hypothetical protein